MSEPLKKQDLLSKHCKLSEEWCVMSLLLRSRTAFVAIALSVGFSMIAGAQEPIFSRAATQPAVGRSYIRLLAEYVELDTDGGEPTDERATLLAKYSIGLTRSVSAVAEAPYIHESYSSDDSDSNEQGLEDPAVYAKWRYHQEDIGPVDTVRLSLLAGLELPAGENRFSSDSTDPRMGHVLTAILGRHGFNTDLVVGINTGDGVNKEETIEYNGSYLFRINPARYESHSKAALYSVLEVNGWGRTDGDNELLLSPGILYEATTWAAELGFRIQLTRDVKHEGDIESAFGAGLRFLL